MQILVMWVFFFFVSATTRTINCLRHFRLRKETHGQHLPFQFHGHPKEGGKGHKETRGQNPRVEGGTNQDVLLQGAGQGELFETIRAFPVLCLHPP